MKLFPRLFHPTPAAIALVAIALVAAAAAPASAQDGPVTPVAQERDSPFGIGFQSSWPAYGLSGLYDVNDKITAQLVVGALGSWTTLSGRGLYHFSQQPKYNIYGFGTAGVYRYSYSGFGFSDSESSVIVGGGAGMELDMRKLFNDDEFPPIYWSFDLGLSVGSFDHYNWSGFMWGGGLHYRF